MSTRARVEEAKGKKCSDNAPFANAHKLSKYPAGMIHNFLVETKSVSSAPGSLKKIVEKVSFDLPSDDYNDYNVRFPRVLHERLARMMGSVWLCAAGDPGRRCKPLRS